MWVETQDGELFNLDLFHRIRMREESLSSTRPMWKLEAIIEHVDGQEHLIHRGSAQEVAQRMADIWNSLSAADKIVRDAQYVRYVRDED